MYGMSYAQLTGTKNIPGDYADLTAAITDLNTLGVGAGGVTLNLLAGNPQTAPAGGYAITTLTGTLANQITITGNGNTITASAALTVGALNDAIFKIIGGDYITIQGFTMQENAANTVTIAATNNMTEFGVALFYATATDGAKNITIQNNTITLSRLYQNTFGIYSNVRHSATAISTTADITAATGANDYTKIYGNNISNVNNGIVIVGSLTAAYMNTGIDVGGSSLGTANTISNYGSTGTFSGYVSVSGSIMGVNLNNCLSSNVSYNTITCPGLNAAGTVYGIYFQATGTLPTTGGPFNYSLIRNTLSIKSGYASGAIYGINAGVGSAVISYDINNNDFNNFGHTVAGTGTIYVLYSSGAGLIQNYKNNTFTALSVNTTSSLYLIYANTTSPAGGIQTIDNNSIVTSLTKTGAGGTVYFIYNYASSPATVTDNWTNNNFSNVTLTGATGLTGFYFQDGGSAVKVCSGNTISNIIGGTSAITCLLVTYGTANIFNNTISGIYSAGAITGINAGNSSTTLQSIYSNVVSGLSSSGASAIYCIQSAASGTSAVSNIYKNNVTNILGSNASSSIYGIYASAGTTINTYNNFVSDLRLPAANAGIPLAGIYASGGTTNNVFYNSVYLSGTSTGALFGSAAIYASTSTTLDMRNNILVNATTPVGATGFASAYRRSGTTLTTYSANSNANCFYAGTPGANNLIMYDGTNSYQTMAAYKTAVGSRDAASFRELPPFNTVAATPYNLHLVAGTPTQCESGGVAITSPIAITDDFDGQTRGATPDIGADEGAFTPLDLTPPTIVYTALSNTASLAARTLAVTITDASGIGSGANQPVLYWKINAAASYTGPVTPTSVVGSVYTYTFGAGVVVADVVSYFVVAQDNAATPNVGSYPAGATVTSNPPLASAGPASPSTYTILGTLCGTKTVGVGGDYATLTAAVADLNSKELCGSLTLKLTDATYPSETIPIVINANSGSSAANTVTIKPNTGVTTLITGSGNPCIITLNGADYVTIDGSNAGGTDKSLTIANTYTTALSAVILLANNGTGATNNTIKNCIIKGSSKTVTNAYGLFLNSAGGFYDNTTIQNNTILNCYYGMQFVGVAGGLSTGGLITGNTFGSLTDAESIGYMGILLGYVDGVTVSKNLVQNLKVGNTPYGIYVNTGVVNTVINANTITDIAYTGTGGYGARGIYVNTGSATSNLTISNNMISKIGGDGYTSFGAASPVGLYFDGVTGGLKIYYNSVNLFGSLTYSAATLSTAVLFNTTTITDINLRDNIFTNSLNNTANSSAKNYAIYSTAPNTSFTDINYNDYFVSGTQGVLGYLGADLATLAALQTATGKDAASVSGDPKYNTATDLHIQTSVITPVSNSGVAISGITNDIDGDVRTATPDMGADEYFYAPPAVLDPTAVTAVPGALNVNIGFTKNANNNNVVIVYNATGTFTTPSGAPPLAGQPFAGGTLIYNGVTSPFNHTGLTYASTYYYKLFSYDGLSYSPGVATPSVTTGVVNPTAVTATTISFSEIDLAWTKNANNDNVMVATSSTPTFGTPVNGTPYAVNATITGGGTVIYNGPASLFNHTALTSGTTYNYKVYSAEVASNYYSTGVTASATTTCGIISTFPWNEGFESVTIPALPPCMTISAAAGYTTTNNANSTYDADAHTGTQFLREPWLATDEYVWTPGFTLTGGTSYDFSFWWAGDTYAGWQGDIYYNTSASDVGATQLGTSFVALTTTTTKTYAEALRHFIPSVTGTYYFAIKVNCPTSSPWYLSFDDFKVQVTPPCPAPISLLATPGNFYANLSWTESGSATSWDIEWGPSGFTQGTGTTITGVTNPYTLTGLSATTGYAYYVRAFCDATHQSEWTGPKTFTTLVACPAPTGLTANNLLTTKADLEWTENGSATSWDIEYGPSGFTQGTGTTITVSSHPYTIDGLSPATAYSFYVRSACSVSSHSTWTGPSGFTTACDVFVAPYIQHFATQTQPPCWSISGPQSWLFTNTWPYYGASGLTDHTGTGGSFAGVDGSGSSSLTGITLTSPMIDISALTTERLRFYLFNNNTDTPGGTVDEQQLDVNMWNGTAWVPIYTWALGQNAAGWQEILVNLVPVTNTGVVQFQFVVSKGSGNPFYDDLVIDDIYVENVPTCPDQTTLTATGITATSAILGWNANGTTSWQIEWGTAGFTQGTGTMITTGVTNPYTLTGLSPATSYGYYVRAKCGATSYSLWAGPYTFTTPCNPTIAPFTEGFEGTTFPPACWSKTATPTWIRSSAVSGYGAGSASAEANFYGISSTTPFDLVTLNFDASAMTAPLLNFDWAYAAYEDGYGPYDDEMDVYYSTNNGSTYTLLLAMPGGISGILNNTGLTLTTGFAPTSSQWATKSLALPAGTNMVKFTAISAYGNNLFLDNVKVYQPLAHDVSALSVDVYDVVPVGSVTPKATVKNEGTNTETFTVNLAITGGYTSTKTVTALGAGLTQQVTFDPWTTAVGNYTATVTTSLTGDLNGTNNTATKAIKVMVLDKVVYGYTTVSTTNNGPIKFNLNDPGTITQLVNEYPVTTYPASGSWANDTWYATIYAAAAPYNLVTFNTVTGARTVIGDMGVNINAMSYNTATSTMYGASWTGTNSELYTINLTTGAATLVGTIGTQLIINMAINNAGVCYATDLTSDVLGTINLTTGAFTVVGSIGFDANYAQDMEFDRETGELYMAAYGSTGQLRWVDKTTGNTLLIGPFQGGAEVTGFAIPYSSSKTLNLTSLFLEGLYNPTTGTMNQAAGHAPPFAAGIADQITIELHNSTTPATIEYTAANVNLSTTGTASIASIPGTLGGTYYITIKHRNSVETASIPVSFATSTVNFAFTQANVYGAYLKSISGAFPKYVIYTGDVNQDKGVGVLDLGLVDNKSKIFATGYLVEDIDGDGSVGVLDLGLIDNNSKLFVASHLPY